MYRIIAKLVKILRIIANGRCWSASDSRALHHMLDEVMDECKRMEDDGK